MSTTTTMLQAPRGTPARYAYELTPGVPAVSTQRLDETSMAGLDSGHAHSHDFLALAYFERGGGSLRLADREWAVEDGDVFVVAPGEVVGVGSDAEGLAKGAGWTVYFPPEGLGAQAPDALLGWRAHPLLFPFARGSGAGAQRLNVPAAERRAWSDRFAALDRELRERRDGYAQAVEAHLALVLVGVVRLSEDMADDLRLNDEPLLADVFSFIEARYADAISLRDVASAVNLTPGHLTTLVRRRTGRTVQAWIAERRMAEARRLLVQTDLTVAEVGSQCGYADPVYFTRSFRKAHGTTPLRWRRAGRGLHE
jgi:AraC family transcriptional regulator, transcriptional activator of pobA